MAERDVARVLAGVQRLAAEGLRVLAVAGGETSIARLPDDPGRLSLNYEGLVAFVDPLRARVGVGEGPGEIEREAPGRHEAPAQRLDRSEEHTSELQSLMRTPYDVFCLKKKQNSR